MNLFSWEGLKEEQVIAIDDMGQQATGRLLLEYERKLTEISSGSLVFLMCTNSIPCVLSYLCLLHKSCVPLLLEEGMDDNLLETLCERYQPEFLLQPKGNTVIINTFSVAGQKRVKCHPDLALLLTTSGSTGSPKLVRLSRKNILSNGESIVEYLKITNKERPVTSLPMQYTYGLSVIHSHVMMDATILLTEKSVMEHDFWTFVREQKATSISGVPYTYQMLDRIGFRDLILPELVTLTQAGGKLSEPLQEAFGEYARETGKKFFIMYGQTEATARMGYLPPEKMLEKEGSMGIPIPGGSFSLDEDTGELVYQGDNVAMGYATEQADLEKGDEWKGILHTGDLARVDQDGFYYITGRKKRFLKLFGRRVSLDETEQLLMKELGGMFACNGTDDSLQIWYEGQKGKEEEIKSYAALRLSLSEKAIRVCAIESIPVNSSGKVQYELLK